MSYTWHFYGYSDAAFKGVFGRTQPVAIESFLEWVQSELGEDPATEDLVKRSLNSSLSYEGLSNAETRLLDSIVAIAFSPEGFAAELRVRPVSPDGLHPSIVDEMLKRQPSATSLLPLLRTGRRYGQTVASKCAYCLLNPREIEQLLAEAERSLDATAEWSQRQLPQVIHECLVTPLSSALTAREFIYGHLG